MKKITTSKLILNTLAAVSLSLVSAGPALAQEWPTAKDKIELIVPFNTGGSADRMARALAPQLSRELNNVPITITNRPGASGAVGATIFAKGPSDGSTLMVMQATPFLAQAILSGRAPVKWTDFHVINTQWIDYAIAAVPINSSYKNFDELLAAIESKKGAVSSATMSGSGSYLQQLAMLETMGLPMDQVRFVTYDGGGPVRTSIVGGHTDFSFVAATGSESIRDRIRSLAIIHDRPVKEWQGPLLNEALKARYGKEMPIFASYTTSLISKSDFPTKYPKRYDTILKAYERVMKNPEFLAQLEKNQIGTLWLGPTESKKITTEGYDGLAKYSYLLTK